MLCKKIPTLRVCGHDMMACPWNNMEKSKINHNLWSNMTKRRESGNSVLYESNSHQCTRSLACMETWLTLWWACCLNSWRLVCVSDVCINNRHSLDLVRSLVVFLNICVNGLIIHFFHLIPGLFSAYKALLLCFVSIRTCSRNTDFHERFHLRLCSLQRPFPLSVPSLHKETQNFNNWYYLRWHTNTLLSQHVLYLD